MKKALLQACALLLLLLPCAAFAGESKLTANADDAAVKDYFGDSVSISADGAYALVGAWGDDDGGSCSGSAYVFTKDNDGSWNQAAKLTASDGEDYDSFGESVSISADGAYALVGAAWDDDGADNAGAAYIFKDNSNGSWTSWTQTAKLTTDVPASDDYFGYSVSISADGAYALVGAYRDDDGAFNSGSAYLFARPNTGWNTTSTYTAKLTAGTDAAANDEFGKSVSISADGAYALVGAYGDDDGSTTNSGSAYIFKDDSNGSWTSWTQAAKLTAKSPTARDHFGKSVSISKNGAYALVGAAWDDTGIISSNIGSAYLFKRPETGWADAHQTAKLTADDAASDDNFGYSVSISADGAYVLVGAYGDDVEGTESGSAYLFAQPTDGWADAAQTANLTAGNAADGDQFGYSVSISADGAYALVGAPFDDAESTADTGSAYVYTITMPDLTTESPTETTSTSTSTSATVSGTITSLHPAPTAYGVCYGTTAKPTNCVPADSIDATNTFSVVIDNLSSGTLYYFRTYATNALGTGYGDDETFSTTESDDGDAGGTGGGGTGGTGGGGTDDGDADDGGTGGTGGASVAVGTPLQYALLMVFLAGLGLVYLHRRQR